LSKKTFKLSDFDSRACDIEVRAGGDEVLTLSLRKFNLLDRLWVEREFSSLRAWEETLFPSDEGYNEAAWLEAVLKTTHHLLEDNHKKDFPSWESLAESLDSTVEVLMGLQKALLYVLHGSEPLIEKIDEVVKKNLKPARPKAKKKAKKKTTRRTGRR